MGLDILSDWVFSCGILVVVVEACEKLRGFANQTAIRGTLGGPV